MANVDRFGYGVEQIDEATKRAQGIAKDHMHVWNRLVENKSPIGLKKDEQQWKARMGQLMDNGSFSTFLSAKSIQDKMVALRDAGINQGMNMSDEELASFLMTHVSSGLTEDPNVGNEAQRNVKEYSKQSKVVGALAGGTGGAIGGAIVAGPMGALAGGIGGAIGGILPNPAFVDKWIETRRQQREKEK